MVLFDLGDRPSEAGELACGGDRDDRAALGASFHAGPQWCSRRCGFQWPSRAANPSASAPYSASVGVPYTQEIAGSNPAPATLETACKDAAFRGSQLLECSAHSAAMGNPPVARRLHGQCCCLSCAIQRSAKDDGVLMDVQRLRSVRARGHAGVGERSKRFVASSDHGEGGTIEIGEIFKADLDVLPAEVGERG